MSKTVEHLEKVLGDLVGNRARLIEQIGVNKQQLDINESQLEHFDTLIASTRVALGDASVIAKIDEIKGKEPELEVHEGQPSPLGISGSGAPNAATEAGVNDSGIPSQG